ncbi:DUF1156 domain-containing protein [Novosphingobium sp. ERN07]|uniref:DUF1156 domain-containing protein n=1 Tax=Novosphingobium sp. ERN07 TaxID=2726187 RepID=UPI00145776EF|nr:DUF1156 domain-containing protein [Novosphingobium sp. ERN07]NLR71708.1 DUF1156 domain-containing protein [Novosphingobium sp. ERN07]
MTSAIKTPKKLIEVALPLDAINEAAAREKSIRHGHPSTLHLWWARRPLAAARAVIFAQMVNDPSWKWELEHPGEIPPNHIKASWAASRKRLFNIIEELVKWENTTNKEVLDRARSEIRKSWKETCEINRDHPQASFIFSEKNLPDFHDPFAGGGALPLEAQRLGFVAHATDLNPVAVLINKAMIEIPPKFEGCPPINPEGRKNTTAWAAQWEGAQGLSDDVKYYGTWMRNEAHRRVGHLFNDVVITSEMAQDRSDLKPLVGKSLTAIAWFWTRTVRSPNPAFREVHVPLASTFVLSSASGREAYVKPTLDGMDYSFTVQVGKIPPEAINGTKIGRSSFECIMSKSPISPEYIKSEASAGRLGSRLMAIVVEGDRRRMYISASKGDELIASGAQASWRPDLPFAHNSRHLTPWAYGLDNFGALFTNRQAAILSTLTALTQEVIDKVKNDCKFYEKNINKYPWATTDFIQNYANAISIYLAFSVSKVANINSSLASWMSDRGAFRETFARQALPMVWDFAEANPFADAGGSIATAIDKGAKAIAFLPAAPQSSARQEDASSQSTSAGKVVSTDPPYYDNVPYADLSDFFYVWLRKSLKDVCPDLFKTIAVPKSDELVADPFRHGGKLQANNFFLDGMTKAMRCLSTQAHPAFPVTIYYAVKQADTDKVSGTASTGWETFLEAVVKSGFYITGTWPVRTEGSGRIRAKGANALASSIVLVCRRRKEDAEVISRRTFQRELNQVLPEALDEMTRGSGDERSPVAPVDLSQSIIGPGMAVFSKYAAVLEADGSPMTVQTALQLINRFLAEDDFDPDTQFCLHWFEQFGWKDGRFGEADTLARAKGTSVDGAKQAGVLFASGGVVRLLKWMDYPSDWDVEKDDRLPIWEALHHLIRVFKTEGEIGAGQVLSAISGKAEATRQLAYRLYTLCERAGWAEDARAYNEIVTSWSAIESAAAAAPKARQTDLFE